jgi:hypothetical protein
MPPDMVLLSHDIQHVSHAYLSFIDTNVNVPTGVELTNSMVSTTSVGAKVANNSSSTMAVSRGGGRGVERGQMPPLTSQKFPLLLDFFYFLFSKFLVAHPKKIIKGQIFFKKIEFHESHHILPFFSLVF